VPFIHNHHLMLQHDNARPHVARICTQFLEAENIPVIAPWTCHTLSMFGILWISIYDSVFQFLPISSNITQPLMRSGPTLHRPQSTTRSTLCEEKWWSHQILTGFRTPGTVILRILEWSFIVVSLRHTCAIIVLSNHHLDMPHL